MLPVKAACNQANFNDRASITRALEVRAAPTFDTTSTLQVPNPFYSLCYLYSNISELKKLDSSGPEGIVGHEDPSNPWSSAPEADTLIRTWPRAH